MSPLCSLSLSPRRPQESAALADRLIQVASKTPIFGGFLPFFSFFHLVSLHIFFFLLCLIFYLWGFFTEDFPSFLCFFCCIFRRVPTTFWVLGRGVDLGEKRGIWGVVLWGGERGGSNWGKTGRFEELERNMEVWGGGGGFKVAMEAPMGLVAPC